MNNSNQNIQSFSNRVPSNLGVIYSGGPQDKKNKNIDLPNLNTPTYGINTYTNNSNYQISNNQTNPNLNYTINETDEYSQVYIKDNSSMINRIKSSNPSNRRAVSNKRIQSAIPIDKASFLTNKQPTQPSMTMLYEENQKIKGEIAKLKIDISGFKKEITQLENEIDKKDKMIDDIANSSNLNTNLGQNISTYTAKIIESKMIVSIKKQYRDLKKELQKKNDEMEEMKKLIKSTRMNELSIENQVLSEELNKMKAFYKISSKENMNKEKLLRDFEIIQENFSKQQFLIISLQDKIENDRREIEHLNSEILKSKTSISEKNKEIDNLKNYRNNQKEYIDRLNNFQDRPEFKQIKDTWEKKIADLKKDLAYFKQTSEKNGARKKELEDENKRLKDGLKGNKMIMSTVDGENVANMVNDNPEESIDTRIKIYKTKLSEKIAEIKILEAENRDLKEKMQGESYKKKGPINTNYSINKDHPKHDSSIMNNTYLTNNNTKLKVENTNVSSNLLEHEAIQRDFEITIEEIEQMEPLQEDSFNEIIYILMKNFEANKIDSSVIDSAFPSFNDKTTGEIIQTLSKSIMYLLKK